MCTDGSGKQPVSRVLQSGSLIMDTWQYNSEVTTSHGYSDLYKMDLTKYKMIQVFLNKQTLGIVDRYPERKNERWSDDKHSWLSRPKNSDLAARQLSDVLVASESKMAKKNSRFVEAEHCDVKPDTNDKISVSALESFGPFMEDTFYRSNTRRGANNRKEDETPQPSLLWGHHRIKPEPLSAPSKIHHRPS